MVGIGAFQVLMRTRLHIESYSPLQPTEVGFIYILRKFNLRSFSCQSRDTNCRQSWVLKLGMKTRVEAFKSRAQVTSRELTGNIKGA